MRRIPTIMGVALLNASIKNPQNWVSNQVQERATNTMQGTKAEPSVTVHVSNRTREKIAEVFGILV